MPQQNTAAQGENLKTLAVAYDRFVRRARQNKTDKDFEWRWAAAVRQQVVSADDPDFPQAHSIRIPPPKAPPPPPPPPKNPTPTTTTTARAASKAARRAAKRASRRAQAQVQVTPSEDEHSNHVEKRRPEGNRTEVGAQPNNDNDEAAEDGTTRAQRPFNHAPLSNVAKAFNLPPGIEQCSASSMVKDEAR